MNNRAEWSLYILRCGDGTFYTGIARDATRRLEEHRAGKGAKYTRGRGPLELIYQETCPDRSAALQREAAVKKLSRQQKLELIASGLRIDLAPMEGVTDCLYRQAQNRFFGGVDRYYTPFLSPGQGGVFNKKELAQIAPEQNQGIDLVPQLLTRRAEDFIGAARRLEQMGYRRVNLNLGCPSGTVTAKGKGAGFLAVPHELDRFLEQIFSALTMEISVKTRLGMKDPAEFPPLLEIFQRYPIAELIVHPRVRQDFYKEPARREIFLQIAPQCALPLCYNGDLTSPEQCRRMAEQAPGLRALMIGRGLIADPSLGRRLKGGPAASAQELRQFYGYLYENYSYAFQSPQNALRRMKELWRCLLPALGCDEKTAKRLRKAVQPAEYLALAQQIFDWYEQKQRAAEQTSGRKNAIKHSLEKGAIP